MTLIKLNRKLSQHSRTRSDPNSTEIDRENAGPRDLGYTVSQFRGRAKEGGARRRRSRD